MRLSNRLRFFLFIFMFLWSITVRYVYTPPHGGDVWTNAVRINKISEEGLISWFLNPLSFFGWYPFSYPTGEHAFHSALSQLTGMETFPMIYFFCFFKAIFGVLSVFVLSRVFFEDERYAFISTILFTMMYYFVLVTWNILTTRALFIIIYPLIIYFFIKIRTSPRKIAHSLCIIILIISLISIHRIILFLFLVVIVPYVIMLISERTMNIRKLSLSNKPALFSFLLISIIGVINLMGLGLIELNSDELNILVFGDNPFSTAINVIAYYGIFYGLLTSLALCGTLALLFKKTKSFSDNFLILICLFGSVHSMEIEYFRSFFTPFIPILAIHLFSNLNEFQKKIGNFHIVIILVILLSFLPDYFNMLYKHYYLIFAFSTVGVIIVCYNLINTYKQYRFNLNRILSILVGLIIIAASSVFVSVPAMALREQHDTYPESGRIVEAENRKAESFWIKEYNQGNFTSNSISIRNAVWAQSGVASAGQYMNVATNPLLIDMLDPQFHLSLLWTSGQKIFESPLDSRYNPKLFEEQFFGGNYMLGELHEINFVIIDEKTYQYFESEKPEIYKNHIFMRGFIPEQKYSLFKDEQIKIYYY